MCVCVILVRKDECKGIIYYLELLTYGSKQYQLGFHFPLLEVCDLRPILLL